MPKTTTQITQEHRHFLKSIEDISMDKYLEKCNKKWYSEEEYKKLRLIISKLSKGLVPTEQEVEIIELCKKEIEEI